MCVVNALCHCREKKQKEEDIAVCVCRYDANDPESACGERCLNVLTSTECTPGYCSCGDLCKNQVCNNFRRWTFVNAHVYLSECKQIVDCFAEISEM